MPFPWTDSARPDDSSSDPSPQSGAPNFLKELDRAWKQPAGPAQSVPQTSGPSPVQPVSSRIGQPGSPSFRSPDPSRQEIFQPGSDGKLHPIPGWHTTGPNDFGTWSKNIDWNGVGRDLGNIAERSIDAMTLGAGAEAIVGGLGYKISPGALWGEIQGHHADPKFLGGLKDQILAPIFKSIHIDFHNELGSALKEAGFLPIGGKAGSTEKWAEYFSKNPEREAEARSILRETTRKFDRRNNTGFSGYLENARRQRASPPR